MEPSPEMSALAHTHDHRAYQQKAAAADRIVLLSMLFAMAAVSIGVQWWRTKHSKSFQLSSFLALWMFPALAGIYYFWTRFLFVWLVYSVCTAYVVTVARQKPLLRTTPRFIYQYFSALYHGCTYAIVGGYFVFLIVVLVAQPPAGAGRPGSGIPKTWGMVITDYLFSGMIYGLYFCVLTRDVAELAAESISNALGYFKKNDDDSVNEETVPPDNVCALCGNECETFASATHAGAAMRSHRPRPKPASTVPQQPEQSNRRKQVVFDDDISAVATATPEEEPNDVITDAIDDAAHGFVDLQDLEAAQNPHRDDDDDSEELAGMFASQSNFMFNFGNFPGVAGLMNLRGLIRNNARPGIRVAEGKDGSIFKLPCKHTFHGLCIKGWTLVGKKNSCPSCNEKVDLGVIAGKTIWGQPSVLWAQLLGAVRYFIVWVPLIMALIRFVLFETGVNLQALQEEEAAHVAEVMKGIPVTHQPGHAH